MRTNCSTLALAIIAAAIMISSARAQEAAPAPGGQASVAAPTAPIFAPPRPEEAPASIRDAVVYGYNIMQQTGKYVPEHVGNAMKCSDCHFMAGRSKQGIPLVGVAAVYPKFRQRTGYATDLVTRVNECFERSMNGKPLDADSKEMQALISYFHWMSRGIPIYAEVPWLGVKRLKSEHKPDAEAGQQVFADKCAMCHGVDGDGTGAAPPLWGPKSFNDGAGMARLDILAGFAHANMPKGDPNLSVEEAVDVAAYVTSRPRTHFTGKNQAAQE